MANFLAIYLLTTKLKLLLRAARFVKSRYGMHESVTWMLKELTWLGCRVSHLKKVHVINKHLTIASYRGQCHTSKTPFIFALGQVDQKLQPILCRKFLDIFGH